MISTAVHALYTTVLALARANISQVLDSLAVTEFADLLEAAENGRVNDADLPVLLSRASIDLPVAPLVDFYMNTLRDSSFYTKQQVGIPLDLGNLQRWQSRWAKERAGQFVKGITNDTRQTIGRSLSRSLMEGVPVDVAAKRVRRYVGLDDRYGLAVDNYRKGLIARGTPPGKANQMSRSYAARLRTARSKTIARTESVAALAQGQQDYYEGLVAQNRIKNVYKTWETMDDEKTCKICAPLDNLTVELFNNFGRTHRPPAHPNCRCQVSYEYDTVTIGNISKSNDERRRELAQSLGFDLV